MMAARKKTATARSTSALVAPAGAPASAPTSPVGDGILYPYQRRWAEDRSRFKCGMFARQTGKTFTTTLEIVLDGMTAHATGDKARWVILSRGERQAKEAIEEGIKRHAQAFQLVFEEREFDWNGEGGSYKALEVVLPGGSRITALPANADTARGFSANVFLDEFAFHQDSRAIWKALFPVISAPGLKLRVVSTPNGKGNKFYELMTGADDGWSRHQVDIYQAIADGLPRDAEELKRALNDDEAWQQEFELQWLDEALSWLSFDLIASCEHPEAGKPERYTGGPCYIGNDIARRRDLWVAEVFELVQGILWCREIQTLKGATFRRQDETLDALVKRYRVVRLGMDQTGMGEKPVEDAQRRYGKRRVEGVVFTSASELDLATELKDRFEDRRIRIPADAALRSDLHNPKKIAGPTGHPRIITERDGGGHADRFWAAALAAGVAGTPALAYEGYTAATPEAAPRRNPLARPDEQDDDDRGGTLVRFGAGGF
jgi:phage FluMu gp28-like protein